MEHDSDDCRAYLHSRGVSPPEKPDLRFFQIRQTEELEPEQRREYIRKGAVSSICLGAVCLLGPVCMEELEI